MTSSSVPMYTQSPVRKGCQILPIRACSHLDFCIDAILGLKSQHLRAKPRLFVLEQKKSQEGGGAPDGRMGAFIPFLSVLHVVDP